MTAATVTRIHEHRCAYPLLVAGVWRSGCTDHFWQPLPLDPPAAKAGRVA